jgi:hypothetical protein
MPILLCKRSERETWRDVANRLMPRKPATSNEAIIALRLVLQLERCRVCRSEEEY